MGQGSCAGSAPFVPDFSLSLPFLWNHKKFNLSVKPCMWLLKGRVQDFPPHGMVRDGGGTLLATFLPFLCPFLKATGFNCTHPCLQNRGFDSFRQKIYKNCISI